MFIVVDASILFSFFKKDSARRHILSKLSNLGLESVSPDFAFEELSKNREKIQRYARINELGFTFLFSLLEKEIKTFSKSEYEDFFLSAKDIAPHGKDVPYFALALKLKCPVWSDEIAFKKQDKIRVFPTHELAKELRL